LHHFTINILKNCRSNWRKCIRENNSCRKNYWSVRFSLGRVIVNGFIL